MIVIKITMDRIKKLENDIIKMKLHVEQADKDSEEVEFDLNKANKKIEILEKKNKQLKSLLENNINSSSDCSKTKQDLQCLLLSK